MSDHGGPGPPGGQRKGRDRLPRAGTDRSRSNSSTNSKRMRENPDTGHIDDSNLNILADSAIAVEKEKISMNYKYNDGHRGPYVVYVDTFDPSGSRKPINAISLNRTLKKLGIDGIIEVAKIGYGRCKVTFKNQNLANNFAYDIRVKENGYMPNIFAHFVSKIGLIFDIPTDITMEEFQSAVVSPVPILKCIRIERKSLDDGQTRIATGRVKVIFDGLEIPREISYEFTKIKVKHYISFAQCYRCFRFNHFAQHCRQQTEVCRMCFNKHEQTEPCAQMMCTNCKNDHHPTSKSCPARTKAYTIKKIMTLENLSISEARMKYSGVFGNRFAVLEDAEEEFPPLTTKSHTNIQNNNKEAANVMHNIMPFSKVVRRNLNRERESEKSRQDMTQWRQLTMNADYLDNVPNRNFSNPHRTTNIEKISRQLKMGNTSQDNTSQLKSSDAEKTLANINLKIDGFMAEWVNYNLTLDQKEFLRGLQNQIKDIIGPSGSKP